QSSDKSSDKVQRVILRATKSSTLKIQTRYGNFLVCVWYSFILIKQLSYIALVLPEYTCEIRISLKY
ncbi:MAG: hypothetical protein ACI8RD_002268, partial [Bacillariaceae sp.]